MGHGLPESRVPPDYRCPCCTEDGDDAAIDLLVQWAGRWDAIYGTGPYSWGNNPWVWVVRLYLVEQPT